MGKHAYLILAHKNLGQLRKLIELLDDERNDIFIHVDKKCAIKKDWMPICRKSSLSLVKERISVNWGGVSGMKSEILLLKEAVSKGRYDYYHLLSGQDLPIKPQDVIHSFFDDNQGHEFVSFWKDADGIVNNRCHLMCLFPEGESKFYIHWINSLGKKFQRFFRISINKGIKIKYGANWFSITDRLARYVIEQEKQLTDIFGKSNNCDEHFLQTLVWHSEFSDSVYDSTERVAASSGSSYMRHVDWNRSRNKRHPWVFVNDDFEQLMSSPFFWARKFDENVDSEIIDRIYNHLKPER